jgi:integrase
MQAGAELLLEMGGSPSFAADVSELLASWLAAADLSITYRADATRVIDKLPVTFTSRRVSEVTTPIIEGLYRQLEREDWSEHRIGRAHGVCSSAFTLACRYGWASSNPFTAARKPAPPAPEVAPPDEAQVIKALSLADERFRLYLLVASSTGARRGELVALQWTDVADDAIVIRRALAYAPQVGVQVVEGKTGRKGHRVVAIDTELATLLRSHRVKQVELALSKGLPAPVWIFSHDAGGTPWRPDFVNREWADVRKAAKLPTKLRPHDLRHYVATQLLAAGVPLKTVSERLGHRQISTTADRYGSYVPAADRQSAQIMAGLRNTKRAE